MTARAARRREADVDVRRRVAAELDRTFFVEAGAGSGKTTALVDRVVALVDGGTALTSIAAITFTEAAAGELRERVRAALAARSHPAAAEVDDAPLLTLHAFAQRILSDHAVVAGLPAVVEVVDDVASAISFDRAWAAWIDALLSEPAHLHSLGAAMVLGLEERHLRALAWSFHDNWDRLVDATFAASGLAAMGAGALDFDTGPLRAALGEARGVPPGCRDAADRLCRHVEDVVVPFATRLDAAASGGDALAVLEVLSAAPDIRARNRGVAGNWVRPPKKDVVALLDRIAEELETVLRGVRGRLLVAVAEEIRRFTLARVADRKASGRLEFHDLLVLTRDLLRGDASVLDEVRSDLSHVLIDEFQDTDPLQVELALLLATGEPADARPGAVAPARADPGRLFFVGDPKQSIYRFRHADVAVYGAMRRELRDAVVTLAANFRSTPEVLDWVNRVFRSLLTGGRGQAAWQPLLAARAGRADAGPPVVTFGGPAAPGAAVAAIREQEAEEIVELVRRATSDPWLVSDPDDRGGADGGGADGRDGGAGGAGEPDGGPDGGPDAGAERWRPARLDDIAILLPTRTALAAIERALDRAGIPSRIESRSLVWASQEARDLLSILRAIDDPSDEVAVVAALRTPALACSDRDLLDAAAARMRWSGGAEAAHVLPEGAAVRVAMDRLEALRASRWDVTFTALVERVVRDLRLLELGWAGPRPREAWARVRFVVDQARAFADAGHGATLRAFLSWADRQADARARVLETVVPEPDHRAVRISTIHAAKGREFPVTIVAGLSVEGEPYRDAAVVWEDGPPELRLGRTDLGWCTSGWDEAKAIDDELDRQEEDRLLYVACTRARDHLCVSLHHRALTGGRTSMAGRLHAAAGRAAGARRAPATDIGAVPLVLPLGDTTIDVGATAGAAAAAAGVAAGEAGDTVASGAVDVEPGAWVAERAGLLARAARPRAWAATRVAGLPAVAPAPDPSVGAPAPETAPGPPPPIDAATTEAAPGSPTGAARGRAVHAVLQQVGSDGSGGDVDALARTCAAAEGIAGDDAVAAVARLARSALASPTVREAMASDRRWREVYVGGAERGCVVEGYVDLLYDRGDGLVVVDYKTDGLPGDDPTGAAGAALVERYRLQLGAYAVALAHAVPARPVVRAVLVVARDGDAVEIGLDGDELAAAAEEARAVVAAAAEEARAVVAAGVLVAPGPAGTGPAAAVATNEEAPTMTT